MRSGAGFPTKVASSVSTPFRTAGSTNEFIYARFVAVFERRDAAVIRVPTAPVCSKTRSLARTTSLAVWLRFDPTRSAMNVSSAGARETLRLVRWIAMQCYDPGWWLDGLYIDHEIERAMLYSGGKGDVQRGGTTPVGPFRFINGCIWFGRINPVPPSLCSRWARAMQVGSLSPHAPDRRDWRGTITPQGFGALTR